MKTITIQIGNSDDKLSQAGWSEFCRGVQMQINTHGRHVHFSGGSDYYQPWQNACWVVEIEPEKVEALKAALILVRAAHRQNSIAWTEGETAFV